MSVRLRYVAAPATLLLPAVVVALTVVGLVTLSGAEAADKQATCGDTITADTRLDSDLVDCQNNGIVIGADDITLDLNGHTISGDGQEFEPCPENEACDVGVLNDGHDGLTIKGGGITAFGPGVFLFRAKHSRLRDLSTVENAFNGIVLVRSSRNRIERSTASRNGMPNNFPGIALIESDNNRITGNRMSGNADLGLFTEDSDENLIRRNQTSGHPEGGMIIEGDRNEIVRNRSVREGGGILITIVSRGGKAVGNVIRGNHVSDARASGIAVDRAPKRTLIRGNLVVGSGRSGIIVGSPSTTITNNRAVRNDRFGIEAVEGVIDGGGNRASGNGRARQCVNVKCR
jgi:parallel beta-helix repeat protein